MTDRHKIVVEKYDGTLTELAHAISDLRYDALVDFLEALSLKIDKDAENDYNAGRVHLGSELGMASIEIKQAAESIVKAWKISKPHMDLD